MNRRSPVHLEWAQRLLAHEGDADNAVERAAAAARVCDNLQAHLAPLLGIAGIRALLARSMTLTRSDFGFLEGDFVDGSAVLRACLERQEAGVVTEAATVLLANFFALITTFIGERLTLQAVQGVLAGERIHAPRGDET